MPHTKNTYYDACLIGLISALMFGLFLGTRALNIPDEGRYPSVALQMLQSHQWLIPRINGVPFLDKPILYYWLEALSIHWFGLNNWAIRLPQALFGVIGCVAVFLFGNHYSSRKTGYLAALLLMISPLYYFSTRYANMDLEVAIWITLTLMALFPVLNPHTPLTRAQTLHRLIWAGVFSGLGFLTKGMIGAVLPGLVALVFLGTMGRFHTLKTLPLYYPILVFGIITLPWIYLISHAMPHFLYYFFVYQQFYRYLGSGFNNAMPFYFYLGILLLAFIPWSLLLLGKLKHLPRLYTQRHTQPFLWYLVVWIAVITFFFSIPHSKIIGYILPVTPALALLIALGIVTFTRQWRIWVGIGMALVCISSNLLISRFHLPSSQPIKTLVQAVITPETRVITDGLYDEDLPILLNRPIDIAYDWNNPHIMQEDNWARDFYLGARNAKTPPSHLILPSKIPLFWKTHPSVILITYPSNIPELERTLLPHPVLLGIVNQQAVLIRAPHGR